MKRLKFLNTYIDVITFENLVEELFIRIEKNIKTNLVYLNSLKIYEISKSTQMKNAIESASLILPDGVPIVWASKILGQNLPERINGTDLFERLLLECHFRDKSVFFLGATDEVLNKMIENVKKNLPNLKIAGFRNGYFSDSEDEKVIEAINKSNADILFIGISSPKKELWVHKYKDLINIPIIKGVGGSFDVLAGKISRAPVWMQRYGLEWFHRLLKEPKRMFKRYLISNSVFIFLVFKNFFLRNTRT